MGRVRLGYTPGQVRTHVRLGNNPWLMGINPGKSVLDESSRDGVHARSSYGERLWDAVRTVTKKAVKSRAIAARYAFALGLK
jgi:hypothetical protein